MGAKSGGAVLPRGLQQTGGEVRRGSSKKEAARFLAQLADVFNQIAAGKNVADKIVSAYDPVSIRRTPLYLAYEKVNKYYRSQASSTKNTASTRA